jgi:hypothetical protein
MRTKKPSELATPSGLLRLECHTAMGAAMGAGFALMLVLIDPAEIATLIAHGGTEATAVFVGTLVLTFAIGATLSGAVFILTEDH